MKLAKTLRKRHLLRGLESGVLIAILFVIVCAGAFGELLVPCEKEALRI